MELCQKRNAINCIGCVPRQIVMHGVHPLQTGHLIEFWVAEIPVKDGYKLIPLDHIP